MKYFLQIIFINAFLFGCSGDLLDKFPHDRLTQSTFWTDREDVYMGLAGCYNISNKDPMWSIQGIINFERMSDNAFGRLVDDIENIIDGSNSSINNFVDSYWAGMYSKVVKYNYFLENIDKVPDLENHEREEMIAEVRFLRATVYFYLSQFFGKVPIVQEVLNVSEVNKVEQSNKEEIVKFIIEELNLASIYLPIERPITEKGRVTKAAALAFLGRILMSDLQWQEAGEVYKEIIDMSIFGIDSRYKELFLEEGEDSDELIFSIRFSENELPNAVHTAVFPASLTGQTSRVFPLNSLIESYDMIDGKSINESTLFKEDDPFGNRDPRLYSTILLPNYSIIDGEIYVTHPDSINAPDGLPNNNTTGYGLLKFVDENFKGSTDRYGGDVPIIRYAEILLSYLECMVESDAIISQDLLDKTINIVRNRASVKMPPIYEMESDVLREIIRKERRNEFAFEGIRYWDLLRWRIAHVNLNKNIFGSKVCENSTNCRFQVNAKGNYYVYKRNFREDVDYYWPIPQRELDINSNLIQNPGY